MFTKTFFFFLPLICLAFETELLFSKHSYCLFYKVGDSEKTTELQALVIYPGF